MSMHDDDRTITVNLADLIRTLDGGTMLADDHGARNRLWEQAWTAAAGGRGWTRLLHSRPSDRSTRRPADPTADQTSKGDTTHRPDCAGSEHV